MAKQWMELPVEIVVFSSLNTSKRHLGVFLGHCTARPCCEQRVGDARGASVTL